MFQFSKGLKWLCGPTTTDCQSLLGGISGNQTNNSVFSALDRLWFANICPKMLFDPGAIEMSFWCGKPTTSYNQFLELSCSSDCILALKRAAASTHPQVASRSAPTLATAGLQRWFHRQHHWPRLRGRAADLHQRRGQGNRPPLA